jgi:IS1 family transposase
VVDRECGGRDAATLGRLLERVERWNPRLYCTDDWAAYAGLIPAGPADLHDPNAIDTVRFRMSVAFVWPAIAKPRRRRSRPS